MKNILKKFKGQKYLIITIIGIALWLIETAYFGWNSKAQSTPEKMFDAIGWLLIIWGFIGDITTNLNITKNTNITTKTVEVNYHK